MKEKIQKYLAGEREGFSLVELIIVIAIMAILIGVIALAVIPNIQRSRESKDLQAIDNVASAVNIAVANNQISGPGYITISKTGAVSCSLGAAYGFSGTDDKESSDGDGIVASIIADLGGDVDGKTVPIKLSSGAATDSKTGYDSIIGSWTMDAGAAKVTVCAVTSSGKVVECKYTADDSGKTTSGKMRLMSGAEYTAKKEG